MPLPGPYVRAKYHWLRGELQAAAPWIDSLAGGREGAKALWLPADDLEGRSDASFENLLALLLADDEHLLLPFADAVANVWRAFPGQVLVHVLEQRAAAGAPDSRLLHVAAEAGVLSLDAGDHDRVGRIVLSEQAAPALTAHVELPQLRQEVEEAARRGAWQGFATAQREPLADVFLDAVFHRSRPRYPEMALDALARLAQRQPGILDLMCDTLEGRDAGEVEPLVTIGMRLEHGSADCLDTFVEAMAARSFDDFAEDCLLD